MIFEKLTKKFCKKAKWYDISLIKGSVFVFTLFLITFWQGFRYFVLSINWYWYLIILIMLMIPIFRKTFSK